MSSQGETREWLGRRQSYGNPRKKGEEVVLHGRRAQGRADEQTNDKPGTRVKRRRGGQALEEEK